MIKAIVFFAFIIFFTGGCTVSHSNAGAGDNAIFLSVKKDEAASAISIIKKGTKDTLLTQVAKIDERPYIHPINAPDGKGVFTQYRPGHHPHQTGLYWGLKMVNGRDYFMKWQSDYWKRVSANVITAEGHKVEWQTVYDLIDEKGNTTLVETCNWSLKEEAGKYLLDLNWKGEAKTDITFGKFYVGGLFIRMPWTEGTPGEAVNAAGQRNQEAEGQRAIWTDVGVQIAGRNDWGHIAIFDNPDNAGFPVAWRVDTQLGVGPSRQILGDWKLNKNQTENFRYRIVVYTGALDSAVLMKLWKAYICEP
ncbi:MAG: PmoA family protein [Chitinophagaceae bacterium]|jgi:hypothetical protein|nr:PmoA family protein [Chitinophagaceae bacterium]